MIGFIFILGAVLGSFLNVCIYRLPLGKSIVFPPSHCPACHARLTFIDLIPVFSYLLLLGRCRHCHKPISARYPLVEIMAGLGFVFSWLLAGGNVFDFMFFAAFISVSIVIFFTDLEHQLIPDGASYFGIGLGLIYNFIRGLQTHDWSPANPFFSSVGGVIVGFGLLFAISVFGKFIYKKEVMGEGDWFVAALLGAFFGWGGALMAIFIAYLLAAMAATILLIFKRAKFGGYVPFGPALVLGGVIVLFFGGPLLSWYWGFFL